MKSILIVVGTRPNFIKVTQFKKQAEQYSDFSVKLVHTGQHYDRKMADVFFEQFKLIPDYFLDIPQGSPAQQIAEIMLRLEKLIEETFRPDLIIVPGDVNSTLAGALLANKMGIRLAHIESGLRSFDRTMPEEFNRILTDVVTDLYFVTEQSGKDNLIKEGVPDTKIHFVGNTMIDTLVAFEPEIESSGILKKLNLEKDGFVLMTMHRPATVDSEEGLMKLLGLITFIAEKKKIIFPVHPRTVKNIEKYKLAEQYRKIEGLLFTDPLDYFSFQKLIKHTSYIITDSGGIQEETTFLQKPCLTLRPNTERPSTVELGSNTLVPFEQDRITRKIESIYNGSYKKGKIPPLWDGKATERIFQVLSHNV